MGERIRTFDWSTTPLGPVEQWPQSLLILMATSLRSRFPIVIWWDRHHYTTLYNDAYIPFLGKTKHPVMLGRSGRDCWREIWPTIGPMLESVFETGQPTWSEDLLLVMDRHLPREETYFTFSYSAIPGAAGAVDGIFCACTETTERVMNERRLRTLRDLASRSSEARSAKEACEVAARLLGQNESDIPFALIYLLDSQRAVAQLVALSGLSPSHQAAPATIVLLPSYLERSWPLFEVAGQTTPKLVPCLQEKFGTLPGGPWPESPDTALVLPLKAPEQHHVTGFLVVGVNPRRVLDEPYSDFFQMVAGHVATAVANARAYEEERKRAEALAELDRAKTVFFSNISHEFRTPLALMLGPAEDLLASSHALSLAQRESIELLRRNVLRLLRLVNTLLDFSRLEAGRMEAVYEPVDLAALTTDVASNFRSAIEKAGMTLQITCPAELPPVYVDQQMWEKIMLNLLSNAFKYTFHGMIAVTLQLKASTVEVSVQDTGVGIPAEDLPHMFERFHRVKGTQGRTFEGTGIGLSLVYGLVRLHGGTIRVTSTLGQGSTFTVSLLLGATHLPPEHLAAGRTLASTANSASTYVDEALQLLAGQETTCDLLADISPTADGREFSPTGTQADTGEQWPVARILFADDNADMRAYVGRLLRQHYDVLTAPDGKAALVSVQQSRPDLVVSDVMMPGMDGFALLHALRANQETRTIPVILLSARAGEEASVEGMQAGADDYLIKPFSGRGLLARVGAHLEMARIRKRAEERVKGERQKLYDLFMQAPAIICVLRGPTHIYELVNPPYAQFVGKRDLLGKPMHEVLPELEGQGMYELLDQVYTTGEPCIGNEVRVELKREQSGFLEEVYFNFVYQPIHTHTGEVEGIMVYAVDVTEQVRSRQQLLTFLGVASHELKNPLTAMKGNIQMAQRRLKTALQQIAEGTESVRPMLEDISWKLTCADQQVNFQNRLISDLVDTTRIQAGKLELWMVLADLNAVVREAVEEQRRLMSTRMIQLDLAGSEPLLLWIDADRIGQVVTNYLSNALKYSEPVQAVFVRVEATASEVRVSVHDQGVGLDEEEQTHIWERFYRAPGVQVKSGSGIGLGLGLYICRTIIEDHGGQVGVESVKGAGATFWFTLPSRSQEGQEPLLP